jgi:hypothetical protein
MAKRQFTKGIDLYRHQLARLHKMQATMDQSTRMMRKLAEQDAKELTSGNLSPAQTKGQYARGTSRAKSTPTGRKRGRAPLLPINRVSQRLYRSIRSRSTGRHKFEVFSRGVSYARYVLSESGTRTTVGRGMKKEARKRLAARQKAHVDYFIKQQRQT